jgi:hypothetical protein
MTKKDSNRIKEVGEIVAACIGLATLIFADITAVHMIFGSLLLVYWSRNFKRPSSLNDRIIVSMAMSLAFILFISFPLNLFLNHYGMAQSWDIVLLTLWIIAAACFFVIKPLFEHRKP